MPISIFDLSLVGSAASTFWYDAIASSYFFWRRWTCAICPLIIVSAGVFVRIAW